MFIDQKPMELRKWENVNFPTRKMSKCCKRQQIKYFIFHSIAVAGTWNTFTLALEQRSKKRNWKKRNFNLLTISSATSSKLFHVQPGYFDPDRQKAIKYFHWTSSKHFDDAWNSVQSDVEWVTWFYCEIWILRLHQPPRNIAHISTLRLTFIAINFPFDLIVT